MGAMTKTQSASNREFFTWAGAGAERRFGKCASRLCRFLLVLSCSFYFAGNVHASQWAIRFVETGDDRAYSVASTPDNGFIVAGYSKSPTMGSHAAWLMKLDASGNVVWQKTYDGTGGGFAYSAQPTTDAGYVVAGQMYSTFGPGNGDAFVLKLNRDGNADWLRVYGGAFGDAANAVQQTADGGYFVAGYSGSISTGSGAWALKLDSGGNIDWQKTYGGMGYTNFNAAQLTTDGGYIVAGFARSGGGGNDGVWVLKLDIGGNVIWQRTYGGCCQAASSIQATVDGGYIVVGHSDSFGAGLLDAWVLKLDANGNVEWQKTYGGTNTDYATSVQRTADGGYIVAGAAGSSGIGGYGAWLLKLDATGNVTWQRTYGGIGVGYATSVQTTADGGYIAAGYSNYFVGANSGGAWVLKLDADGYIRGCANIVTTNVVPSISNTIPATSTATVVDSSATPVSINIAAVNSSAVAQQQCYYAVPVAADIPTLSQSGLILMSTLLALCATIVLPAATSNRRRE